MEYIIYPMTIALVQLDEFKASFERQLAAFIESRKKDIGNPADWKPAYHRSYQKMLFRKPEKRGGELAFKISDMPTSLSPEGEQLFREAMYQICTEAGFQKSSSQKSQPREPSPSLETEDGWRDFVERNSLAFERYAAAYLDEEANPTFLEPSDIVDEGHERLLRAVRRGEVSNAVPVINSATREIFRAAAHAKKTHKLRKEAAGWDMDAFPDRAAEEQLRTQLPAILEKARPQMSPGDRQVLDIVLANYRLGEEPLSSLEIGRMLGAPTDNAAKKRWCVFTGRTASIIQKTARAMGPDYANTASLIDAIVNANNKKGCIKR